MIILKLGGSLITDKKKEFSIRQDVIDRAAREIKEGAKDTQLIIVHGGGSFGHPVAERFNIQDGFKDKKQIQGIVLTRKAMTDLNQQVITTLLDNGLPVISLQPSAFITCSSGRIDRFNIDIIKRFLELETIPVLFGDVVLDKKQGFCILSGDQIIANLSAHLNPERIILATDVDGIFDKDPKKHASARLIKEINQNNFNEIYQNLEKLEGDVTGGIKNKVMEIMNSKTNQTIINALVPGRLKKALLGEEVRGTKVIGKTGK